MVAGFLFALKMRDRILKKVIAKNWSVSHKFGQELPKSEVQKLEIDGRMETDFWRKALEKEMHSVFLGMEFIEDDNECFARIQFCGDLFCLGSFGDLGQHDGSP